MGHSIGFKGSVDIVTSISGSIRQLRVCAFMGRGSVGACDNSKFRAGDQAIGIVDLTKGRIVTSSFGAITNGAIALSDTGGLGSDGAFTGHELLAFVIGDTGTLGA